MRECRVLRRSRLASGEAAEMSEESVAAKPTLLTAEDRARVFAERAHKVMSDEDRRRAAAATKTAKLRELRLAKEAAERGSGPKGEAGCGKRTPGAERVTR
jgi:hypothetical protein